MFIDEKLFLKKKKRKEKKHFKKKRRQRKKKISNHLQKLYKHYAEQLNDERLN